MPKATTVKNVEVEAERYAAVVQLMRAYQVDNFLSLIEALDSHVDRLVEMMPSDPNRAPPPIPD